MDAPLDGDDAACAIGEPGVDVFHSLFEVGGGSRVGGVECGISHLGGGGAGAAEAVEDDGVIGPCEFCDMAVFDKVAGGESWV